MVISHLHDVERHDFAFFAPIAPRLQKTHHPPFAKELICKRVSLGAQANFLSRSPHSAETFTSAASLPWPSTHSFHHPNLTRVSVNSESFMLLATASMPNLKHLAVTLGLINKQHLNIIERLLQRAEIKLHSFSLTLTRPYEDPDIPDDIAASLATIPTLQELSISFSDEDRYNQWDPCYAVRVLHYLISRIEFFRLRPLNTLRMAYFVDMDRTPSFDNFFVIPVSERAQLWTRLERFGLTVKVKGGAEATEGGMDAEELEELARTLKAKTMQALNSPLLHDVQFDVVYEAVTPSEEELEQIREAKRLATARRTPDSWRDNIPYYRDWYSESE
ncbi:hypothetical protein BDZ89DRAFT_1079022 [Hymenopellis radicata]|nr:hypothetical protein BDZ89DRAFT_1079022 [Hymenopellis radicata]